MNAENRVEVLKKMLIEANVAKKLDRNREKTAVFKPRYLRNGATERRHFALVGKRDSPSSNLPLQPAPPYRSKRTKSKRFKAVPRPPIGRARHVTNRSLAIGLLGGPRLLLPRFSALYVRLCVPSSIVFAVSAIGRCVDRTEADSKADIVSLVARGAARLTVASPCSSARTERSFGSGPCECFVRILTSRRVIIVVICGT